MVFRAFSMNQWVLRLLAETKIAILREELKVKSEK